MESSEQPRYWFPARKRLGWGWGPPATWQGRLVVLVYGACTTVPLMLTSAVGLGVLWFWGALVAVTTPALVWICFKKGEPPGPFRW